MSRVFLVPWKEEEILERARKPEAAGYEVDHDLPDDKAFRKLLKSDPPAAVVVDLGRLPSNGREIGIWLRDTKATRSIPLVFVDGEPAKVERTRQLLPDATYTTWSRFRGPLRKAISNPPQNPVAPGQMAGYSGKPLPQKLGIKAGACVALINAPEDFEQTLGTLPENVTLRRSARGKDVLIWFPGTSTNTNSGSSRSRNSSVPACGWPGPNRHRASNQT